MKNGFYGYKWPFIKLEWAVEIWKVSNFVACDGKFQFPRNSNKITIISIFGKFILI